ncbi:MAG: Stk1 family PASTA domain-containing Ser/Thr kinase [Actinomycetota bacterium]
MSEQDRVLADRYQVGALIGRGGMADVFAGNDLRLGRKIAIKLLKSDLANDETFESRFAQEAQASAKMAHPTIVRIYDAGEEVTEDANGSVRKTPFIIMEYVKGRLLRDIMHDRRLGLDEAINYAKGVLTALEYSHRAGIIHRDIKASNIMITEEGAVKVMDFGIARAISDSSATQAHTSGIVGTAQYFSPEQARGEAVDARTDLYSTGVLLYEMLAGRPPFKGDTAVSVAYQHVSEKVVPPSEHNPEITAELDEVVLHALAKDREERFQSAEEFRDHLIAAASGNPVTRTYTRTTPMVFDSPTEVISEAPVSSADDFFRELGVDLTSAPQTTAIPTTTETKKSDRPSTGLLWGIGSGVGVVLVGLIIWLITIGGALTPFTPPSNTGIPVADVTGALFDDGAQVLRDQNLLVLRLTESSDTVEAGYIIRTDPPAGTAVPERTTIEVYVSSGKLETGVPLLSGLTEEEARAALESAGLVLGVITPSNSATIAKGLVIESVPAANSRLPQGSTVNLLVSDGQVQVPNVRNLSVSDAQRLLLAPEVGFTVVIESPLDCLGTVGSIVEDQSIEPGLANQKSEIILTLNCVPSS